MSAVDQNNEEQFPDDMSVSCSSNYEYDDQALEYDDDVPNRPQVPGQRSAESLFHDHNWPLESKKRSRRSGFRTDYQVPPLSTMFAETYVCYPISFFKESWSLENGNQIVMPQSVLNFLDEDFNFPMLFEIRNPIRGRISHCGVAEFTAEEGMVLLPGWMMENLQLQIGDQVSIKTKNLEKGTFMKLQPHSTEFLDIVNPKAVLEGSLSRNFFCVTTGDTIVINNGGKRFYMNVVETRPSSAVSIVDVDCEVDFAPPLDYVEPPKTEVKSEKVEVASKEEQKPKLLPFAGPARRLGGEPSEVADKVEEKPKLLPFTGPARRLVGEPSKVADKVEEKPKLLPFTGPARRLIGEPSKVSDKGEEKPKLLPFTGPARQMVIGVAAAAGGKTENVEAGTSQKFQPFSGKKYSLLD